jgi:hypothetical protein
VEKCLSPLERVLKGDCSPRSARILERPGVVAGLEPVAHGGTIQGFEE